MADTIAALSTPPGQAGIGIVRISGPLAKDIAGRIFRAKHPPMVWTSHLLTLGRLVDPDTGVTVDEVLLSYMKAPHSYTREDVVEINTHSGHALVERILRMVLNAGARAARAGEFTFRAFMNGRIDLTQAEAVMDLIQAKSEQGVELASGQLCGRMRARIESVRRVALDILAHTEVGIDYPEEMNGVISGEEAFSLLAQDVIAPLSDIRDAYAQRRFWADGVNTAIVGRVNTGKSSLLNRLAEEERAIVTEVPGTTRDVIEALIYVDGLPIRLLDTAGYRTPQGEVERIGVERTDQTLKGANLALVVVDRSQSFDEEDRRVLQRCADIPTLVVLNKIDLPNRLDEAKARSAIADLATVSVSALTGEGMDGLRRLIRTAVLEDSSGTLEMDFLPNARQNRAMGEALDWFQQASNHFREEAPLDIVAVDLNNGLDALAEITGARATEETLDRIFQTFCLGK
jgi:tRNA modification GTPase